uniref:CCHC-type domain-containing protein n=1 Tax=Caenorhabditis japonica TaxID=281687 RepID=A0A8R1E9L4_CAEJA
MLTTARTQITKTSATLTKLAEEYALSVERYKQIPTEDLRQEVDQISREVQKLQSTSDRLTKNMAILEKGFDELSKEKEPTQEEIDGLDKYAKTYTDAYELAAQVKDDLMFELGRLNEQLEDYRSTRSSQSVHEAEENPDGTLQEDVTYEARNDRNTLVEILQGIQMANTVKQTELKPFKGDRWEFDRFMTIFEEVIGKTNISELLKLHHLLNALEGEPREHLESFELKEASYKPALAALKEKYGDKKKAVSDLLSRLKKEEAKSESIKDQRRLLDKVTAIANQLLLLDPSLDNPLTRELIWGKFKYKIQKDSYGVRMSRGESEWTIKTLLKDMNQIVTRDENLLEALPKRIQEKSGPEKKTFNARHEKPSSDNRSQEKKTRKCLICNRDNHYMTECKTMPNPQDRTKFLEKEDRCGQCLRKGHKTSNCNGKICNKCNKSGHYFANCPNSESHSNQKKMEKKDKQKPTQGRTMAASINSECNRESQDSNEEDAQTKTATAATSPNGGRTTSIPTVQAEAYNPDTSTWESISLMIDTGADLTFISEKIAKNWKLPIIKKDKFTLTTFKSGEPRSEEYALTKVKFRVPNSNKDLEITPYISNELVGRIKKRVLPPDDMMHLLKHNIQMNKDAFETSVIPDMIIGDDFVTLILTGKMVFLPSGMALLDTVFGNTTIGRSRSSPIETDQDGHYMFTVMRETGIDEAQRVEEQQKRDTAMKKPEEYTGSLADEKAALERATVEHFKATVEKRGKSFYVRLHFKDDREELPDNYSIAVKRLVVIGRQYSRAVLKIIDDVFRDQIEKGILEIVDIFELTGNRLVHYNPHQPVFTPTKTTTKCRVVVDGSAHYKNKPSLNDQIHQGPTILPDLVGMLLRFRSGGIAVISDAEKAFLQVYLHEDDRDVTRLLWVKDIDKDFSGDNIMVVRFTRVLFGLNVSPFLLAATINHHLETIDDQDMAHEMSNNLYVTSSDDYGF